MLQPLWFGRIFFAEPVSTSAENALAADRYRLPHRQSRNLALDGDSAMEAGRHRERAEGPCRRRLLGAHHHRVLTILGGARPGIDRAEVARDAGAGGLQHG